MAPLSGKQQREYLKFQNKEAREVSKMGLDEMRKQQLHELKLQEAAAKAKQGLGYKEQVNNAKLKDMGIPPARMNKQKLGIPTQNPLAGTGMFKQGQRSLAQVPIFQAQGTDTVPAMLTPGEAVIPRAAAQNPKNKKAIKRMVQEGRKANMRDGAIDVRNSDAPMYNADGTSGVPSLAYRHPDVPGSSFMHGTMSVPDFSRGSSAQANYANGSYGVVPQQVQSAAGYNDGTENVSYLDRLLNFVAGQDPTKQLVVAPLASNAVTPTEVSKEDFFKMRSFAEASNDPKAKQKQIGQTASSLTGTTAGTLPLYQKINPKLQGVTHNSEAYFKPEFQRELSDTQYDDYAKQLRQKGLPLTVENLYAAGFGPRGVSAIAAKDDEPLDKHFTKNELKQNTYFGKTAGDFKNFVAQKATKAGKSLAQAATDIIPSAQAGTLPVNEVPVVTTPVSAVPVPVSVPQVPAKRSGFSFARDNIMDSGSTTAQVPPIKEAPLFNQNQQDLIRLSEIINDPATTNNDRKWAYSEINRITRNGEPVVPTGTMTNQERIRQVTGSNVLPEKINKQIEASQPVPEIVPDIPKPVEEKLVEVPKDEKAFNAMIAGFSQQVAPQLEVVKEEAKKIPDPVEQKSFLERSIASLFGKSGLFGDQELIKFSLLAAGGMLTGGSVGGSLKFAGLNTLQSAEKRQAVEAASRAESAKNLRELRERLDSDYRTALGENVPPDIRKKAMELYSQADTEVKQRAVINLLKSNKNVEDKDAAKPGNVSQGFFDGKPIQFRNFKGEVQLVNPKGEWETIKPLDLKRFESAEDNSRNRKEMESATTKRLVAPLKNAFGKQKGYDANAEADKYTQSLLLLKEDLGPNVSPTSFAKMSENAVSSAIDFATANGKASLTEEGLRKAFFGNAVIEVRMKESSRDLYATKGDKGKLQLPSAEYQVALGTALDVYKKQDIPLSQAVEQIENRWNGLSPADKKKFTDMSKGAPGSTPMLYWLKTTGGNI
jgi:hypothetical protein